MAEGRQPPPKGRVVGKSVRNEKMNPDLQNNGPKVLPRRGLKLRGRGRVPGTAQPRRINRVRAG